MKTFWLRFAVLLIAGMAQAAENFEIISYFPDKGTVRVNQGAGQTNRPFSSFTSEEQKQITDWLADQEFENSGLSVTIKKQKRDRQPSRGEVVDVSYFITLENRSKVDFKGVSVNANIFYQMQDGSEEKKQCIQSTETINLSPGETRTVETKTVSIRDGKRQTPGSPSSTIDTPGHQFLGGGGRAPTVTINIPGRSTTVGGGGGAQTVYMKDRLQGLYLCVSKKNREGELIKQEFEDGNPPEKEKQDAYRVFGRGSTTSTAERGVW